MGYGYVNALEKCVAAVAVATVVVIFSAIEPALAQTNLPCVQELVPCADYLNSTSPPASCCGPLKNAFANELPCVCAIFNNPAILKSLGIDIQAGLALIQNCNISGVSSSLCSSPPTAAPAPLTPTPATPNSSPAPLHMSHSPAPAPAPPPPRNGGSSLYRATSTGMVGLLSLLVFLWFIAA